MNDEDSPRRCDCEDDNEKELCFVEGSIHDKEVSYTEEDMTDSVWKGAKPEVDFNEMFGNSRPFVSARKIDITRAVLNGKFHSGKSTLRVKKKP